MVELLESKKISLYDELEKIVLTSSFSNLAYVDGRKTANKLGFDIWQDLKQIYSEEVLKRKLKIKDLYTDSQAFPDFMFKSISQDNQLIGGEILELKDSKGGGIASFNSTIPTEYKTLKEIERLNGSKGKIVIKIAEIFDKNSSDPLWKTYKRKCFYLIRTHKTDKSKIKVSIVDGAFFETIPEEKLISLMFQNIFNKHAKEYHIPDTVKENASQVFQYLTDHSLISFSQDIPKASIKPRLRIMAEAKNEGNPHWEKYNIPSRTLNLVIKADSESKITREIIEESKLPIKIFTINHQNDGEFLVFSYRVR
ncbi:hypothetical protein [Thermococcus paralvinellae]|uniref:Uncharacterized protein n=1 Tax=Thermococcus paralvinellae TaxID=582419 RepID=W0I951_9EURY|nr:hypothetical protein [Thermococcus paralvinellae]AHF81287.1 Hypothetical protein TES1_1912 [Thermococcus paralvinellae]